MKRITLIAAALLLSGCGMTSLLTPPVTPPAPATIADRTRVDEQAALSVELAYQAANLAIRTANSAGALSDANKLRAADLDNRAYKAVLAVRAAYDAGNATNYGAAAAQARQAITDILELVKG